MVCIPECRRVALCLSQPIANYIGNIKTHDRIATVGVVSHLMIQCAWFVRVFFRFYLNHKLLKIDNNKTKKWMWLLMGEKDTKESHFYDHFTTNQTFLTVHHTPAIKIATNSIRPVIYENNVTHGYTIQAYIPIIIIRFFFPCCYLIWSCCDRVVLILCYYLLLILCLANVCCFSFWMWCGPSFVCWDIFLLNRYRLNKIRCFILDLWIRLQALSNRATHTHTHI